MEYALPYAGGGACPRCGGWLYPDLDGLGCLTCGWHHYDARARQGELHMPEPGWRAERNHDGI